VVLALAYQLEERGYSEYMENKGVCLVKGEKPEEGELVHLQKVMERGMEMEIEMAKEMD
jgi:hypothetical protein